ncbi:class I SAM-dependent methyltransferase [Streptomyces sp. PTY087I2]|uniref:class I SAM-dependent methyltransferase n=1 Tax=Streptomyces sp. PTY087I2 TaxID=1819298 RepID=UPI00080B95DA|nr:class I SAM-dependent methyltransferase [Streptomyces sp. PTY087I2]OCC14051.1 Leucine carboxyl methyltransferase [Streptomyces sp. PTY087I2]
MVHRHQIVLGPAQETLLIPLYGRAVETRKRHPMAIDPRAVEIVEAIDYDFAKFDGDRSLAGSVLRGLIFDHWVAGFLRAHPCGTVVEIGAGLNTRFERLDNGSCHWVELDLPDSMDLRRKLFEESDRRSMIAASVVDDAWVAQVREYPGPYFFVAEAVLIYLTEADARRAAGRIAGSFPDSTLAFDTWGEWILRNQRRRVQRRRDPLRKMSATLEWACDDPREIESWHPGITLTASHTLATPPRAVRTALPLHMRALLPVMGALPQTKAYRLNLFALDSNASKTE